MSDEAVKIAFQGAPGAYSDMAARALFPGAPSLPCASFGAAFEAVRTGTASHAVIPVDNTLAGRVADVHELLGRGKTGPDLVICGEYFLPVIHCLLGVRGAKIGEIRHVWSHVHALPQCKALVRRLGARSHVHEDTAGAAAFVAQQNDPTHAAIASALAAEIYGLAVLETGVQDASYNYTRFIVLARAAAMPAYAPGNAYVTSMVFQVENSPAALYKALEGFAINNVNLTKLESYQDERFMAARFFAEVEDHPDSPSLRPALEMLRERNVMLRVLGCYPAHEFRRAVPGSLPPASPERRFLPLHLT